MYRSLSAGLILVFLPWVLFSQTVGPAKGTLIAAGGAVRDAEIYRTFIELAGGGDAPIVVIPTAGGGDSYGPYWQGLLPFKEHGAKNLTLLHTYDRSQADSADFVAPLKTARGVWFTGGRQWRLVDAYGNTRVHEELLAVLDRGGVIGGSSAGATIQGSFLARGDSQTNTVMMGDHQEGLALLRGVAIDQHLLRRNRHFDLLEIVEAHPELLGIGLDEDTAIGVRGDWMEVIGRGYVGIYDARHGLDNGGEFYFLSPGDRFDLAERKPFRMSQEAEPLERVVPRGEAEAEEP